MNIIKRGKLPEEKVYEGTCDNCKTEVEFRKNETVKCISSPKNESLIAVVCPICGRYIWVDE